MIQRNAFTFCLVGSLLHHYTITPASADTDLEDIR